MIFVYMIRVTLRTYKLVSNVAVEYHVSLNSEKTILFVLRGILLGHLVSEEDRLPDPNKVKVIAELPPPMNVPKVRNAFGHTGWYCEAIEDYANTAIPLTNLTKNDVPFMWTQECQNAFDILKGKLTSALALSFPIGTYRFVSIVMLLILRWVVLFVNHSEMEKKTVL